LHSSIGTLEKSRAEVTAAFPISLAEYFPITLNGRHFAFFSAIFIPAFLRDNRLASELTRRRERRSLPPSVQSETALPAACRKSLHSLLSYR
jgi:hypothetical protein